MRDLDDRKAVPVRFHHIAIQTCDLENSKRWYLDYLGAEVSWSLSRFSEVTLSRLPGIRQIVELVAGEIRLHLFEREISSSERSAAAATQFQHVCFAIGSHAELVAWRERWLQLFRSGRYRFALLEPATEIVVDAAGVESFYAFDVNGLELELTYQPGASA